MTLVRQTRRASEDLLEIWAEIALDDPAAADRQLDRIAQRTAVLEHFPMAGPVRADIGADARVLVVRPYLILYRIIDPHYVQIVRVVHGARHIAPDLFSQEEAPKG